MPAVPAPGRLGKDTIHNVRMLREPNQEKLVLCGRVCIFEVVTRQRAEEVIHHVFGFQSVPIAPVSPVSRSTSHGSETDCERRRQGGSAARKEQKGESEKKKKKKKKSTRIWVGNEGREMQDDDRGGRSLRGSNVTPRSWTARTHSLTAWS
ncbi:hypothetical protein LX36DRAFT_194256 [Colletotrichum falcatum]|nr:hypothetical protein LX36DRAFT_194256 [Colletotrichum falcatum]